MNANSQRQKCQDDALQTLNAAIAAMDLVGVLSGGTLVKTAFNFISAFLAMIRVRYFSCDEMFQVYT